MKIMIVGCGLSGLAVADFLSKRSEEYFFARKEDIESDRFDDLYIQSLLLGVGLVIVSPGINPKKRLIVEVKKRKIPVIGEFEFGVSKPKI